MDPKERWFEDWAVGDVLHSGPYRMDEQRMIDFALEFDPQRFHTDPELAAASPYGGLIASGWHTASAMMRLLTELLGPASLGSGGGSNLRWLAPVRPNDELTLELTVVATRPSAARPDRGTVSLALVLHNQDGRAVLSFDPELMMARRPAT